MKKFLIAATAALVLAACANTGTTGNTQAYGEIKGGVESTH